MWIYNDDDGNCLECGGKGIVVPGRHSYPDDEEICLLCEGVGTVTHGEHMTPAMRRFGHYQDQSIQIPGGSTG